MVFSRRIFAASHVGLVLTVLHWGQVIRAEQATAQESPAEPSAAAEPPPPNQEPAQAPPDPTASAASDLEPDPTAPLVEVTVRANSASQHLRESSRAVKVIETDEARRHTADLGAVLARTEGVAVQRGGGLGSPSRLSLHGLTDDQIRRFLDGVPLEFSGFGFGIATVPLSWIERIDVYRGVVPVAFGADALGGAIDLVTDQAPRGTTASVSYAAGAFDTHQFSLNARSVHEPTGFLARAAAFYDTSANDYVVDVNVPDELGQLQPARVRRFHDGYAAGGASLELGLVDRPWAKRLLLRLFATEFDKELQHNVNMTVPYGAVDYGQTALGGTLRYEQPQVLDSDFSLAILAGYSHRNLDFRDASRWVYDWFGNQIFERAENSGELSTYASDLTQWEDRALARGTLGYRLTPQQALQLVVAPEFTTRSGVERLRVNPDRIDPLTTRREILQLVTGLEHRFVDLDDVVDNSLFAKYYLYHPSTDQVQTFDNSIRHIESTTHQWGAGDALRVRLLDELMLKASYEYATRLPRPDEVFGDGALVTPNLDLIPESSHNANLGALAQQEFGGSFGHLELEVSGFLRRTSNMIVQLPTSDRLHAVYQNVVDVRTLGVDGSLRWVTARQWLTLETNATWQDQRNTSDSGPFAPFEGQRVPNRPWLFANASATLRIPAFGAPNAELLFTWLSHYVREFQPGWSDNTATDYTGRIPTQFVHAASATYSVRGPWSVDASIDVQNLTNERVYDVLGVQEATACRVLQIDDVLGLSWRTYWFPSGTLTQDRRKPMHIQSSPSLLPLRQLGLRRFGVPALLLALGAAACSDSDTSTVMEPSTGTDPDGSTDGEDKGPLYLMGPAYFNVDDAETYLVTTDTFDANTSFNPTSGAKVLGEAIPIVHNGSVYITDARAPVVARFDVGANDQLVKVDEVSFAGVGITDIPSWFVYIVSDTKGYVFDPAGRRIVVWNPSTMTLSGVQIDLPELERDGWTPRLALELFSPWRRGAELIIPVAWTGQDEEYRFANGLLVLDVERDLVVSSTEDERCGESYMTVAAANGDRYFFPSHFSSAQHFFADEKGPTCVLRVLNGESTFDPSYQLDLSALEPTRQIRVRRAQGCVIWPQPRDPLAC